VVACARTNLRHVQHNLRHALHHLDRFLEVSPRALRWRPDGPFWLDVAAFHASLSRADGDADGGLAALREAVELYRGACWKAATTSGSWVSGSNFAGATLLALERLATLVAARGEHAEAVVHAERLLRQDPLHEQAYRLLMGLHDARGDRARALRTYHACAEALGREFRSLRDAGRVSACGGGRSRFPG
jgi:DNA-binding SARP family transcriptional activator